MANKDAGAPKIGMLTAQPTNRVMGQLSPEQFDHLKTQKLLGIKNIHWIGRVSINSSVFHYDKDMRGKKIMAGVDISGFDLDDKRWILSVYVTADWIEKQGQFIDTEIQLRAV